MGGTRPSLTMAVSSQVRNGLVAEVLRLGLASGETALLSHPAQRESKAEGKSGVVRNLGLGRKGKCRVVRGRRSGRKENPEVVRGRS